MKTLLISGALVILLSACGERPQTVVYKQGEYQGKVDAHPYDSPPWNGDKAKWENDIRARGQNQNEYKRTK
jgi:uncharacterized lipoprotein